VAAGFSPVGVSFAGMRPIIAVTVLLAVAGCEPAVYVRDGVTDGDSFHLAPRALTDDDPVLQSWVTYSLVRSACQLGIGGDDPARATSYGCEFSARLQLLDTWEEKRRETPQPEDAYLDTLLRVRDAGFLDEYTVYYFGDPSWQVPAEVDLDGFDAWRRNHLGHHRPQTRLVGWWSYDGQPPP
jgi:hypothetical protein